MFFGKYNHKLNAKNQVTIPARFRELIPQGEKLYMLKANPDSIFVYTQAEIEKVVENMRKSSDAADPAFRRKFTSSIMPVDMDAQGRIVIPADMKKATGIGSDVMFTGNAERMEIWPFDRWTSFEKEREEGFQEKLGSMMDELFEK